MILAYCYFDFDFELIFCVVGLLSIFLSVYLSVCLSVCLSARDPEIRERPQPLAPGGTCPHLPSPSYATGSIVVALVTISSDWSGNQCTLSRRKAQMH